MDNKPAKPTKLNTHRHRKRVRKSIDKKKQDASKKNQERYGDVSGGSKVVQRYKSDIVRAPAYKAERLTQGGYHSTYPVREGMLDKEMNQRNLVDSIIKRKQNELSFHAMYKQMAAGDFDKLEDDYKRQVMEVNMQLEKEKMKNKYARELKTAQDKLETARSGNIALLDGYVANHVITDKAGNAKAARKRDIRTKTEEIKSELDAEIKKTKAVKTLIDTSDQLQQERIRQSVTVDAFKEKFKENPDMLSAMKDDNALTVKAEELKLQLEEAREQTNRYKKAIEKKRQLEEIDRDLQISRNELFAEGKWENPQHAARIADIYKKYPSDQQRLMAMDRFTLEEERERRNLYGSLERAKQSLNSMQESSMKLKCMEDEFRKTAVDYIVGSKYVSSQDKRGAYNMTIYELEDTLKRIQPYAQKEEQAQIERLRELHTEFQEKYATVQDKYLRYEVPCKQMIEEMTYLIENAPG